MESLTSSFSRSSSTDSDVFSLGGSGTDLGAIQCTELATCIRSHGRYDEAIDSRHKLFTTSQYKTLEHVAIHLSVVVQLYHARKTVAGGIRLWRRSDYYFHGGTKIIRKK